MQRSARPIYKDHDLARTDDGSSGHDGILQKGPCERGDQEEQGKAPHEEQDPVPHPPFLNGTKRDLVEEHERRKLDHVAPLLLREMHEHRDCKGNRADKEEGCEEGHDYRTLLNFSRDDRNANRAESSGSAVFNMA